MRTQISEKQFFNFAFKVQSTIIVIALELASILFSHRGVGVESCKGECSKFEKERLIIKYMENIGYTIL